MSEEATLRAKDRLINEFKRKFKKKPSKVEESWDDEITVRYDIGGKNMGVRFSAYPQGGEVNYTNWKSTDQPIVVAQIMQGLDGWATLPYSLPKPGSDGVIVPDVNKIIEKLLKQAEPSPGPGLDAYEETLQDLFYTDIASSQKVLKNQLIRLGYQDPSLRDHLRPIIAAVDTKSNMPRRARDFDKWMRKVDRHIQRKVGMSYLDLPDAPYRDWFNQGVGPKEAANMALEFIGFGGF